MGLTREQIEGLKCYRVVTDRGRLIVMPFIREGEYADFRTRVYLKGASGFIETTQESVAALGLPMAFADKAKAVALRLSGYYPALPSPETIMAEAQLAGLPVGKAEPAEGQVVGEEVGVQAEIATEVGEEKPEAEARAEAAKLAKAEGFPTAAEMLEGEIKPEEAKPEEAKES